MKILHRLLVIAFALGLCADLTAAETKTYPQISVSYPSGGKGSVSRDDFVILVIEGPTLSYESSPLPREGLVDYVNHLLKEKNATYLGVYVREGVRYGDAVNALDTLRHTDAKDIGVSMATIPVGREL